MDKPSKDLFEQIKGKMITKEDAIKQIKIQRKQKFFPPSSPRNDEINNTGLSEKEKKVPDITLDLLKEKSLIYFKKLLSSTIKLPVNRIEGNIPMEKYGIDSIMVMRLTNQLEKVFGSLSKTLFFEYQTIEALTEYFVGAYREQLIELIGIKEKADGTRENFIASTTTVEPVQSVRGSCRRSRFVSFPRESLAGKAIGALDIAMIGVAGRYPEARDIQEYWKNLRDGKDCIKEIPQDRWDHSPYFDEDKSKLGKTYSKWGGFLEGVDQFDPLFFNISPREAEIIDPQERLFLQCVFETLEDGGYTRQSLGLNQGTKGNVGVYVGVMYEEYQLYGVKEQIQGRPMVLSGNPSSIANRVSYFCNFHGPSMAVDTMCSSSLTAIHLACQSLQRGECELAIAGGVNVSIHPNKYLALGQGKFLSSTGRCESFGQAGDGYVPGEGVGAVLLKPMAKAVADRDQIYGIIKGTAINHGGKTNGYSVPNPNAQVEVIGRALKEAGINPRTFSYLEAHGTGTSLGDPIEIAGLNKTFQEYTQDKQFCAIGSAKSNIGHCESAAGIAGVTKVLLQLKYHQIVPSLHSQTLNPNIDFSDTPFVVQQKLTEWRRPVVLINGETREYPRIAGISSFGAGGSNAHVVIEEYIPQGLVPPMEISSHNPAIIVLSAKNEARLREQVQRFLTAIQERKLSDNSLADISYTLQVGREAMEERLAMIVESMEELEEKLRNFLKNKNEFEELYRGSVKRNKETLAVFEGDEELREAINKWIQRRKYSKLLNLWVKGLEFDWNKLYGEIRPQRMSLPTYPFARERYWVPQLESESTAGSKVTTLTRLGSIHPLLQQNTSDLSEQRFSSTFTGREFFLTDHVVKNQRVFPGVAYLEMARAAVEQAAGTMKNGQTGIRLKNVVWVRPIVVGDQAVQVHIGLFPEDNGEIGYKIYCQLEGEYLEPVIHSQGSALLAWLNEMPSLDLLALQAECTQSTLVSSQCYEKFKELEIDYGPAHQGIKDVYVGLGQVLAKLCLPSSVFDTRDQFVLHPSLMDSALQASIGLIMGAGNRKNKFQLQPFLPFALQEIEIFGSCTSTMWALIRYSEGSDSESKIQKLDIDLCDEHGMIRVRMKGFSSRVLEGELKFDSKSKTALPEIPEASQVGNIMLTPVWDPIPVEVRLTVQAPNDQVVIIGGDEDTRNSIQRFYVKARVLEIEAEDTIDTIAQRLGNYGSIDHVVWIVPHNSSESLEDSALITGQNQGVLQVFRIIKALLRLGYGAKSLDWSLITIQAQAVHKNDQINPAHASIFGLTGSLAKEFPNWKIRLVDLEAGCHWPVSDIFALSSDIYGDARAYRNQEWYQQKLILVSRSPLDRTLYKQGGVYVVIGGAGGIGEVWSEYMVRTYQAQIIWIGRRPKDVAIQAKLDKLANLGQTPYYIAADATDQKSLNQAYEEIKERHAQIHGVIHSAIVLLDQSLANMEEQRFRAALSAKVDVSVTLAQVFKQEPLDFVMFFSSMNSFGKPAGQSNYAAGCTFTDAFAHQLSREWPCAVKVMNWGYWGSVGIVASETYKERMAQAGIGSLEAPEAMEALETLLAGPVDQIALLKTTKPLALEEINSGEVLEAYPENLVTIINSVKKHIIEQSTQVQMKPEVDQKTKDMDELLCRLLWGQLRLMGLSTQINLVLADIKTQTGLRDLYDRWLEESIAVLARKNYLQYKGETCTVIETTARDVEAEWEEWDRKKGTWLADPNLKALVVLVEATLRALPEILTGKRLATDIMFPNSSMELVEGIYKNSLVAGYFNEVLANTVVEYIKERLQQDPTARIRILEIGAGTGGTSMKVFQKLKPYQEHIQEYCYTDISKTFLMHAEKEYGPENPYLTYKLFNVEAPIAGQNISAAGYDLVIATNVLHATKNISQTLRNAKAVLKNCGVILINELSSNSLFAHLTFGLLEGWWFYEDSVLRIPGCPGISPETWQVVLESEGFRSIFFPAKDAHDLGQQIVVAESDGVVRQKQPKQMVKPLEKTIKTKANEPAISQFPQHAAYEQLSVQEPKPAHMGVGVTDQMLENHVQETIIEKLVESLKVDVNLIDADESFADYGIDSITGVQVVQAVNATLMIELETTSLFDYSSVNQLTKYILGTYRDMLAANLGQNVNQTDGKDLTFNSREKQLDYSHVKRFLRKRELAEPLIKDIEKSSKNLIQKDPIAIIGMSGRFAKSNSVNELWKHISTGTDLIEEATRWDFSEYEEMKSCRNGSFLEDIDKFDPLFFKISGLEATYMDPQQRLFLEESWKAMEDAGYVGTAAQGRRCGVYVGCARGDYQQLFGDNPPTQAFWGNMGSVIPGRIAYNLDLQGPAIAVDTACSSSLVAIHLACQGLWAKETEMALAGGVYLQCTPEFYVLANRAGMLSSTGRCYTFDERADGFVPGEGVGVVVLKRLQEAIADGDHIYGVIRGSGINQDGTTNGLTAPSSNSQERLESYVYDTFNINPENIQMVEAHGTGTKLGDPIEYQALARAFRKYTSKKEYCAIGSIKTNLGHTQITAGVAGVIKILLSLQNKKIPPSLNFQAGNSNIQFEDSPFYVNTTLKDWDVEPDSGRCAAVSAFGVSGTNAHMAIEEAPKLNRYHAEKLGYLVVLSARTYEQLSQQVEQLVEYCEQEHKVDCGNMSYTLLLGRKHFNHRLSCVIRNMNELVKLFRKWLEGGKVSQIYVSEWNENDQREQPSLKRYGNRCIQNCQSADTASDYLENLATVAELYTQGYALEFEQLFPDDQYSRISLPTYPFARERYWISNNDKSMDGADDRKGLGGVARLHPLIESNISTLHEEKFVTYLTGDEFFLSHHIINGQMILPGVAFIEMVRAAGELAGEKKVRRFKDFTWLRPVILREKGQEIFTVLNPNPDSGEIDFQVSSIGKDGQKFVHAQGKLIYENHRELGVKNEPIDIIAIKERCTSKIDNNTCYNLYREMGLQLGPGFRVIQELYANETEVLALLKLPEEIEEGFSDFSLHPALMDGALQSGIGLSLGRDSVLNIPFVIGEVEILGPLPRVCYAYFVAEGDSQSSGLEGKKCNIRIMDETGKVLIRMMNFVARPFQVSIESTVPETGGKIKEAVRMYFHADWEKKEIGQIESKSLGLSGNIVIFDDRKEVFDELRDRLVRESNHEHDSRIRLVRYGEYYQDLGEGTYQINPSSFADYQRLIKELELQDRLPIKIIHNWSQGSLSGNMHNEGYEDISVQLDYGIYSLFFLSQALMQQCSNNKNEILILYLFPGYEDMTLPQFAAVSGFAKTIPLENAKFVFKTVELEAGGQRQSAPASLQTVDIILNELQAGIDEGVEVSYRNGQRRVKDWKVFDLKRKTETLKPLREKGVYLITGGIGGLGMIFARYLAREVKAKLVLVGRSELDLEGRVKIEELKSLGSEVVYVKADVSKSTEVKNLISEAKSRFKSINGIIHCAGITRDAFLQKKSRQDVEAVLAPKVYGTIYLDQATIGEDLHFFVLFSSLASVMGNTGQCDYAYANSFLDYYSEVRENLRRQKKRTGKTFCINWPLWKDGGLKVDRQTEEFLQHSIGVKLLETEAGLNSFAEILNSDQSLIMALKVEYGKIPRIMEKVSTLKTTKSKDYHTDGKIGVTRDGSEVLCKIQKEILRMVANISQFNENRIKQDKNLADYGFDSLSFVELANQINKKYEVTVSPAIFFEHPSINAFSHFLYREHEEKLFRYYKIDSGSNESIATTVDYDDFLSGKEKNVKTRFQPLDFEAEQKDKFALQVSEPIAIIGMSGVMPRSEDLDKFWANLEASEDLITKVPEDRWEWGNFKDALTNENDPDRNIWGGFIEDIDKFDPLFFGISPREAEFMDPQQRIFLEMVWKTIEDAGYRVSDLSGTKTGLYVGVSTSDYADIIRQHAGKIENYLATGTAHSVLSNRVSYLLNFHGPSEPVDTACSSALIAVHRAVESIRSGSCEMAIVGGVNVLLTPSAFINFIKVGMLSEDGRCKTFDKNANGYVRGEGAGAVFLKPLSRAIRDGDHIYGLIKGIGVNHGGRTSSLTVPNPMAQSDLIKEVYEKAGVDPATISYIEAHGTGTNLGDPIEVDALKRAFSELYKRRGQPPQKGYCGIGSVKTNIGHLEAAAGIAGLFKVLLAMKHRKLPATVHFKELNPYIQLDGSPFYIVRDTKPWENLHDDENKPIPRRAGVSSFGFGGANAHVLIEEFTYQPQSQRTLVDEPKIIVLSAKNEDRLKAYANIMVEFLIKVEVPSISTYLKGEDLLIENVQKYILHFVSENIHVDETDIDPYENMAEYGFDHVQFLNLATLICTKYELDVKIETFTESPSINKLAQFVVSGKLGSKNSFDMPVRELGDSYYSVHPALSLGDMAYTLQVGREPLERRLALIASSIQEVKEKLIQYCRGDNDIEDFFQGNLDGTNSIPEFLLEGNEGKEYLNLIIREKKIEKLARLWVLGVEFDWKLLYPEQPPRRVSLPTYPFARERYWVPKNKSVSNAERSEIDLNSLEFDDRKPLKDLLSVCEPEQRLEMLESYLNQQVYQILKLNPTQQVDLKKPLVSMGLDSLMALQLKKQIEVQLNVDVSIIKFLGRESTADLAKLIFTLLVGKEEGSEFSTTTDEGASYDDKENDLLEGVI